VGVAGSHCKAIENKLILGRKSQEVVGIHQMLWEVTKLYCMLVARGRMLTEVNGFVGLHWRSLVLPSIQPSKSDEVHGCGLVCITKACSAGGPAQLPCNHDKDPIDSALRSVFRRGSDERRQLERFVNQSSCPNFPLNQILWIDSLRVQNAVPSRTNNCSQ
jgi:hypothetical protein